MTSRGILLLATAFLAAHAAAAAPSEEAAPPDPSPGDRGFARTVIQGSLVEEIPVRYLARQRDVLGPGNDLHLIQLEGALAERVGVAAGMSGSPVYFDGRLIGALSYRLGILPVDPVAGVTPIADMRRAASATASAIGTPIATPLHVGGLTPVARRWIEPQIEGLGFRLVAGEARAPEGALSTQLVAGSAVGVALVRGDLSVAATGTVTLVEGERVYAFGHAFLGAGTIELPMVAAEVIHTLADEAGSVKLARIGDPIGAFVDDRITAIVGRLGAPARTIPLALQVRGGRYGDRQLHFDIARSHALTPLLATLAVVNSLAASTGYESESTAITTGRIRVGGYPDVPIELAVASQNGQDAAVGTAVRLQQILSALWRNPFADLTLDGIELEVAYTPGARAYQVEGLHYDRVAVHPGAIVPLTCSLRRYRGSTETRRVELPIPAHLPADANLTVAVGPPDYIDQLLGQPVARRLRSARDIGAAIDALHELGSAHRLQVVLLNAAPGLVARGMAYGALPATAETLLGPPRGGAGARTPAVVLARVQLELDGPADGGLAVGLDLAPEIDATGVR